MNHQKIEENVAKFLALGFVLAQEQVNGYPLVYRRLDHKNHIVCREIYIVNEEVSPDSLPATS